MTTQVSASTRWLLIIPVIMGIFLFFIITGGKILHPQYIDWLMEGDPAQHWLGWQFFRSSPLTQWPLGANLDYGRELGSSIVFTDSIPIMAFIFKPFNVWLPERFQYFGIWILLCFVMQAFFSWKLLARFTNNIALLIIGTLFFLIAPAFLWRLHGHYALFSHWILIAGLYFYYAEEFAARRWAVLITVSILVHAYLAAMALSLLLTDVLYRRYLKQKSSMESFAYVALLLLIVALAMWSAGYFMVGGGVSSSGFGVYRMNLLSLIDPNGTGVEPDGTWSRFLPDQKGIGGDYEGYNYLGIGILGLTFFAVYVAYISRNFVAVKLKWQPLALLSAGLFVYAISNRIVWGEHEIFHYSLPQFVSNLAETFRASGRFFWPVYYVIYVTVLAAALTFRRKKFAIIACLAMLCFQVVDSQNAWRYFRYKFTQAQTWISPMASPLWTVMGEKYKAIIFIKPSNGPNGWLPVAQFAATHNMTTNAGYFARVDSKVENQVKNELSGAVHKHAYNPDFIYIFNDDALWNEAVTYPAKADVVGVLDGYRILAPGLSTCTECDLTDVVSVEESRLPPYSAGMVSYESGADNSLSPEQGWSYPDGYGSWSQAATASVDLAIPELPNRKLALKITAVGFLAPMHLVQEMEVFVNGMPVQGLRYDMETPSARIVKLPRGLQAGPDGKIRVTFKFKNPASPLELGVSTDSRLLGINLHSLEVISVD